MNDERGARMPSAQEGIRTPEQIQARLRRLERVSRSDVQTRGYMRLVLDVLGGVACGSIKDPAGAAAAVLAGIDGNALMPRIDSVSARKKMRPDILARPTPDAHLSVSNADRNSVVASLIRYAERAAQTAHVDPAALDYLYRNSRWNNIPRLEWDAAVRTACTIELMPRVYQKGLLLSDFVEPELADSVFDKLKSSNAPTKGTLLLTFHGAFVVIARRLFAKSCKDGLIFGKIGTMRGRVPTTDSHRDALFTSLRVLQDGGVILMAPDGQEGRQSARLTVLGADTVIGEGAAFLAHAANCNTAWYTVVKSGDSFVPVIEPGPTRRNGETIGDFTERLYGFYATQIERIFTGDPHNILLRPMWSKLFSTKQSAAH